MVSIALDSHSSSTAGGTLGNIKMAFHAPHSLILQHGNRKSKHHGTGPNTVGDRGAGLLRGTAAGRGRSAAGARSGRAGSAAGVAGT